MTCETLSDYFLVYLSCVIGRIQRINDYWLQRLKNALSNTTDGEEFLLFKEAFAVRKIQRTYLCHSCCRIQNRNANSVTVHDFPNIQVRCDAASQIQKQR